MRVATAGPMALGPWLVWAARQAFNPPPVLPRRGAARALPELGTARALPGVRTRAGIAHSSTWSGIAGDFDREGNATKTILDLCSGSGAWSSPYKAAGYNVWRITLPVADVHTLEVPDKPVHGILCAPPCTEFSLAKNGQPRDIRAGLETVSACLRLVVACRPSWWALENPIGLLGHYLGTPRDTWQPYEFGDPHTKATAVWGEFNIPVRGPFVQATCSAMDHGDADERAITPEGFARAFFEANP